MGQAAEQIEEFISWDTLTYECWARGELSWKLRPEQREFKRQLEEADKQLVVANISRRWGKSFTLVLYCIEQCIRERQNIRYGAAFKTDLEEFILPAFEIILADCPEDIRPRWKASKKTWFFPTTGSTIKLVGLDKNRNGLRGNAISKIVLDEAGFVAHLKYQYESVIIPATAKQRDIKILVASTPPESPDHYFVKLMHKAQAQENGYYIEMDIDTISDLQPDERKRLLDEVGGEESTAAQREFFCKIIIEADRALAPAFSDDLIQAYEPEYVSWRIFGDTGAKDKTVFLKVGYCHETGLIVFRDEYVPPKPRASTSEIIAGYKEKWTEPMPLILDASVQLIIDYSTAGLPAIKPEKADFEAGLLLFNNACFNKRLVIHPNCRLLITTLKNGMLTKKRNDYERTDLVGHCDAHAAGVYALRGVDKITDLRPKPDPMKIFVIKKDTPLEANIKNLGWSRTR